MFQSKWAENTDFKGIKVDFGPKSENLGTKSKSHPHNFQFSTLSQLPNSEN